MLVCCGITGGLQDCCISINLTGRGGGESKKIHLTPYKNVIIKFEIAHQLQYSLTCQRNFQLLY